MALIRVSPELAGTSIYQLMKRPNKITRPPVWVLPSLDPAARAMVTASELFALTHTPQALLTRAAEKLAAEPGRMCLISQVRGPGEALQPVAIAHARKGVLRRLCEQMRWGAMPPADAFSLEVQRTGGSLRMSIANPRQLRLWLPGEYAAFAERMGVGDVLAAALTNRSHVVGTLLLWRERDQSAFGEADEAYVSALAGRLGMGLPRVSTPPQSLVSEVSET